jgi:predicted porin
VPLWLLATHAGAQSRIELYGVLDVGFEHVNHLAPDDRSESRITSGGESSVRFGLRGRETIGPGLHAVFQLEGGVNIEDGSSAQGGRLFGRVNYVGLESERFGHLSAGRHQNMALDFAILFDPVGRSSKYSTNSLDVGYVGRSDDAVKYIGKFGQLQAEAMSSFGGGSNRYSGALASVQYGALRLGLATERVGADIAGVATTVRRDMLGASYALSGKTKLAAAHTWRSDERGAAVERIGQSWIGLQSTVLTGWYLSGTLYMADFKASKDDPKNLTVLLAYNLSKRTDVYLTVGRSWNSGSSNMGVFLFGTVMPGMDQTGISAGLCHAF